MLRRLLPLSVVYVAIECPLWIVLHDPTIRVASLGFVGLVVLSASLLARVP